MKTKLRDLSIDDDKDYLQREEQQCRLNALMSSVHIVT